MSGFFPYEFLENPLTSIRELFVYIMTICHYEIIYELWHSVHFFPCHMSCLYKDVNTQRYSKIRHSVKSKCKGNYLRRKWYIISLSVLQNLNWTSNEVQNHWRIIQLSVTFLDGNKWMSRKVEYVFVRNFLESFQSFTWLREQPIIL